ncbi:MAG: hypothetical protein DRP59_07010 [Spirochaetes bacterium]|nr:MAG: hypothetical protein DRP59_07010 [Spirochaetota bacterium]
MSEQNSTASRQVFHRNFRKPYLHNILSRTRLHNLFKKRDNRKLTLIHAKAGQGKSIFLSDYLDLHHEQYLWMRIDTSMKDPRKLLTVLNEGINCLDKLERENTEITFDTTISLLNRISEPLLLIFDDYQYLAGNPESEKIITDLIEYTPSPIRFFILSRTIPDFPLSKLRSKRELFEIGGADLKFNLEEITALFEKVFQLSIEKTMLETLDAILQGWITGYIFLIEKLSCFISEEEQQQYIQSFINKGQRQEFFEFFSSEVFNYFTSCEKNVLIALSPFNTITNELAICLGGKESGKCLDKLIHDTTFMSKDAGDSLQYHFHPLFADYLKTLFNELEEEEQVALLRKTVPFFEKSKDVQNLIPVLIKLGEIDQAKKIFVSYAEKILDLTQHNKIRGLLKLFPLKVRTEDPLLGYYSALALNLEKPFTTRAQLFQLLGHFKETGDIDRQARIYITLLANFFFYQESKENVKEIVRRVSNFLDAKGEDVSPDKKEILLALLPLGKDWIDSNKDGSFENAMRAEETSFKLNNEEAFLCSRLVLARNYLQCGEFSSAQKLLNQTWNMIDDKHLFHPYAALLKFYLGDAEFYSGDIHKAIQHVQEGLNISSPDFAFRPYLELNLILYNLYLNNIDQAEKLFESTRDTHLGENLYLNYYRVYLLQMLIAYRNQNWRRAEYYLNRLLEEGNESLLLADYPYSYTALIEVSIGLKNYETARSLLSTVREDVSEKHYLYTSATLFALECICNFRENKSTTVPAKELKKIIKEYGYRNLDICNPQMLEEVCKTAGIKETSDFTRLKSVNLAAKLKNNTYSLDIHTFGSFGLFIHGNEIPSDKLLSQKRVMDLLKLLIIYRKTGIHKDTIYETFWPKYSYKSARDNLNTIIYRLRNIFGKENTFLSTEVSTIGFVPDTVHTDVDSFLSFNDLGEKAALAGETGNAIELFKEAIALYKGDFLEGDLYSDFIRDERESLKRTYLGILFTLSKLFLSTGDFLQAIDSLKKFNNKEPLYEPATRLYMIASSLIGSRSSVPRIFEELNHNLRTSYDISPDSRTVSLKNYLTEGKEITAALWEEETFI